MPPTKADELVDVPLRMEQWQRGGEGNPVVRCELIGHAGVGVVTGLDREPAQDQDQDQDQSHARGIGSGGG